MARTQDQRKAETRQRLLDAAAALFAARGIEGVSIDAIADAAGRTSGAVYAHFGGKEGVATALLDSWKNEAAAVIAAEFVTAPDVESRLATLWRSFADAPSDGARAWLLLEHELWLYACRHVEGRAPLAERYQEARDQLADTLHRWSDDAGTELPADPAAVSTLLVAVLIGLEMQHRIDPAAVPDEVAVAGLLALLGARPSAVATPLADASSERRSG